MKLTFYVLVGWFDLGWFEASTIHTIVIICSQHNLIKDVSDSYHTQKMSKKGKTGLQKCQNKKSTIGKYNENT